MMDESCSSGEPPKSPCQTKIELDRFSSLPGHIIDQIFSQLSIRDAVRTSVLSTKWRYKWAALPNLVLDKHSISLTSLDDISHTSLGQAVINRKLVSIIDHVLLLHTGPVYKFRLSHRDLDGITDIDRWILHMSRSPIREFDLEIWKGQRYKLHSCLFSCQNLTHLQLFNCLVKPPSTFHGFKNLKSLDLQHITMGEDVFEHIITGCPLLERLTLMNFDGFSNLNIDAPSLLFFYIGGVFDDVSFKNTFQLAQVSIGLYAKDKISKRPGRTSNLLKFFAHLPHIRRLEIQSHFLKYLAVGNVPLKLHSPCVDLGYLSLRINFDDCEENKAALCLLRSSPNLRELEILARPEEGSPRESFVSIWEGELWSCMFDQLRLVKVTGISGTRLELGFISFLLSASPALERMTMKPASANGQMLMMKELLRFRRASVRAEIIYLDP